MGKTVREPGVLDRDSMADALLTPPGATPTMDTLPRRMADFATLGEALDYAARGVRGMNFHDARGTLVQAYPFVLLREDALAHARRFMALGLEPGDRLALVAETGPDFAACFFGAVYAGLWPVPLPLPTSFGGREAYVEQLKVMLSSSDPALFLYPEELADFAGEAARQCKVEGRNWESLDELDQSTADLPSADENEIAYLQYSSGSTRFPHGVAVTHRALLDNLHSHGVATKVGELIRGEDNPNLKLRVFVQGGGCSGFQYGFTFDENIEDGDTCIENQGVKLIVDPMSYQYLMGAEIDYREDIQGAQFVIRNPNATTTCGCGSSFSV